MRSFCFAALMLISALCVTQAAAQNYPTRAIHILISFPPGGPSDVLAGLSRTGPAPIR
jgi:tripartite-type tricarboxylate transporter receptor subunit TctC